MLQVLVHLVCVVVLDAFEDEIINLVVFNDGTQAEGIKNFIDSARLRIPFNIIEAGL